MLETASVVVACAPFWVWPRRFSAVFLSPWEYSPTTPQMEFHSFLKIKPNKSAAKLKLPVEFAAIIWYDCFGGRKNEKSLNNYCDNNACCRTVPVFVPDCRENHL